MGIIQVCTILCLVACLGVIVKARDTAEREMMVVEALLELRHQNSTFAALFDQAFPHHTREKRSTFHCPRLSPSNSTPTSVHQLRPGDIQVVAASGDSLTAGRGIIGGIFGLLADFRGMAWSIGGDNDYYQTVTIPNILRLYNPNLRGFSQGVGSRRSRMNVAVTGAVASETLGQAIDLVSRLKSDSSINMANDWKLITIFIGANDLCDWCENKADSDATHYKKNLQDALDYLLANVPRAFVNLVVVLKVDMVAKLGRGALCQVIHKLVCDCAANPISPEDEVRLIKLREEYQKAVDELIATGRYDVRDDFTVVAQPFFSNTSIPQKENGESDLSYFASDCFHLSEKGHVAAAQGLWNNMIEPFGSKRNAWNPGEVIKCPTEDKPYLYTSKNSNPSPTTR